MATYFVDTWFFIAYLRDSDPQYSPVDCASMRLMLHRGIRHVLTNDHHFAQEGFTLLNA